jgi:hypothetical protein
MSKKKEAPKIAPAVNDLLYQALETELGGVQIYRAALRCATDERLRDEWRKYLEQTESHVETVKRLFETLGLDPDRETPGRQVVRHLGRAFVKAMDLALGAGAPDAAQLVAAECVQLAETKDHLNWEMLGEAAEKAMTDGKEAVAEAQEKVEDEEDEHLYHTMGWVRELWIQALGLKAELPPPEEAKQVKNALQQARVQKAREAGA